VYPQLQVECRTAKVRRPKTDVIPLCHTANHCCQPVAVSLHPCCVCLQFQSLFGVSSEAAKPPKSTPSHPAPRNTDGLRLHHLMAFQFLLCTSAFLALAGLTIWHARLIHCGETSIESHINRQEAARQWKLGLVGFCLYSIH